MPLPTHRLAWACLSACVLVMTLTGCSRTPEQKRASFVERGEQYGAAGDYARAAIEFHNALESAPRDAELHYKFGQALLGQKRPVDAYREFQRAVELDPKHREAGLRLAQIKAASGDPAILGGALEQAKAELEARPDSNAALDTVALLEMRLGKLDDAVAHLEAAMEKYPSDIQAALALSGIRLARQDAAGAEKVLADAAQANRQEPRAYIALARLQEKLARRDEAQKSYRQALERDSANATALLGLARLLTVTRQIEEADGAYRKIAALPDARYRPLHAMFLMETGKLAQAIEELEKIHQSNPADRVARGYLMAGYERVGRRPDALKVIEAGLAANPKDTDLLLGRSRLSSWSGDLPGAERDLIQVLKFTPDSPVARFLYSKLKQQQGDTGAQKTALEETLRLNRGMLEARFELATLLTASAGKAGALQVMDEAPKTQQSTRGFRICRNWVLASLEAWSELAESARRDLAMWENDSDLLTQEGLARLGMGNHAGARQSLEEALRRNRGNFQALHTLVRSHLAEGQTGTALARVREFSAARPGVPAAQHLLGTALLADGKIQEAEAQFQQAKQAHPQYAFLDLTMAQIRMTAKDWPGARKILEGVLARQPKHGAARLLLGSVEELSGDIPAAIEQYRQTLAVEPNHPVALNNLAYLLASQPGRLPEAQELARRAVESSPDQPAYRDTLGWVLCQKGQYAEAVKHLEKAAALNVAPVQFHLAYAYLKAGNSASGWKTLQKALQMDPSAPEAKLFAQITR